ncbi:MULTISPECIES: TetR/AcrR family transcriptional regulator [Streptomyces]|uniref:TetR/AcrR family transcriptional regulator n=1 Tax=Streptomyces dengpaensis TaxID=2049881 RepID=A0ABM6SJ63_9ACTN|nr:MULTISPECIES: TetR/AcrR family transcriptional regulator [Streptomyces]AVH54696.1 TetR/AcrR family transcriptional regulator [Streptomyces dengpaensis]PIA98547.1 TetR family transcriptional regulator [Streptomyces sp. HG99]
MPKLWNATIEEHRNAVRKAALDATAALVSEQGPLSVTMSRVAERSGIGRATLYKYFPDVESVLAAWHERLVTAQLDELAQVRDHTEGAGARLHAVLDAYALHMHSRRGDHGSDISALLHQGDHMARAHQRLVAMVRDLIADAAAAGELRADVDPDELAPFCLHALSAARAMPTPDAVRRLVAVTLTALAPAGAGFTVPDAPRSEAAPHSQHHGPHGQHRHPKPATH